MKQDLLKGAKAGVVGLLLVAFMTACSIMPTGAERVALVDELVAKQEYGKAERLLANIDARDPAFEELLVRRRAIRPLMVRFEENTIRRVNELKDADQWPEAKKTIAEALAKMPSSKALQLAEQQFHIERGERLQQIDRQLSLLRGEHLAARARLVEKTREVNPSGLKTLWRSFSHDRETRELAEELADCGENALDQSRYDLAKSCIGMAASLTDQEPIQQRLARLEKRREKEENAAIARARARKKAEEEARLARNTEKVAELKDRYQHLVDAGWLVAAREILAELKLQAPRDPEIAEWSRELETLVDERVASQIQEGQTLYSSGRLHEALAVWRNAAKLEPDNGVLQAHISRVERFIAKLERLDEDDA